MYRNNEAKHNIVKWQKENKKSLCFVLGDSKIETYTHALDNI
jgi:hypothetical protein